MREIKFRAWDGTRKEMFVTPLDVDNYAELSRFFGSLSKYATLIQYTGRKDKHGVEIYEDTLLEDPQGNIGKVFYSEDSASYLINWHRKDGTWDTDNCFGYSEVVGSVWENSELLK